MCQNPFDDHYAAYGGVHDRLDRVQGRVGSLFDPAASLGGPAVDEDLSDSPRRAGAEDYDGGAADDDDLSEKLRDALYKPGGSLPPAANDET